MTQYAYNSAEQASVGTSPFYLMYSRHARSPLELRLRVPSKYQEDVEAWAQEVNNAREKAVESLLKAQAGPGARVRCEAARIAICGGRPRVGSGGAGSARNKSQDVLHFARAVPSRRCLRRRLDNLGVAFESAGDGPEGARRALAEGQGGTGAAVHGEGASDSQ